MNCKSSPPSEATASDGPRALRPARRSAHVAALPSLPLFHNLTGRRVVLAGGTAAAAWKAELIAGTGAEVHVYAELLEPEFAALIAVGPVAGRIVHHSHRWTQADLCGATLALADAEDDAEAASFAETARAAGVPVNVIDKPAHCDFAFGSIVNRSPVLVAISTTGAAPILGQHIRQRIETLLPHTLADWGRMAVELRAEVTARFAAGAGRRKFWEAFADRALASAPPGKVGATVLAGIAADCSGQPALGGKVTVIGAGPGDPELLTIKALRALQGADVILFDAAVDDAVLELARREARRLPVGDGHGARSCRPADLLAMLMTLAGEGKSVVRLVVGDAVHPALTAAESKALAGAGIPVRVIAGVANDHAATPGAGPRRGLRHLFRPVSRGDVLRTTRTQAVDATVLR